MQIQYCLGSPVCRKNIGDEARITVVEEVLQVKVEIAQCEKYYTLKACVHIMFFSVRKASEREVEKLVNIRSVKSDVETVASSN